MTDELRGQEVIATKAIPAIIAPLTLYISKRAVSMPPQKIPIHMVGERIFVEFGHIPSTIADAKQPASSTGVSFAPVMRPIPALYPSPIIAGRLASAVSVSGAEGTYSSKVQCRQTRPA